MAPPTGSDDSLKSGPPSANTVPKSLVQQELQSILASAAFQRSQRCSDFLRLIVLTKLDGHSGEIKERTIATEVFGRDASYDPKNDAVVRVNATDVRKRLAQYYQTPGVRVNVRITLPPGGYVPAFEIIGLPPARISPEPAAAATSPRSPQRMLWVAAGCVAVLAFILWFRMHGFNGSGSDAEAFWHPYLIASKPVAVCVIPSIMVRLSDPSKVIARVKAREGRHLYDVPVEPGLDIGRKLVYDVENHINVGDALALASVCRYFGEVQHAVMVKSGAEVSFLDMKGTPAVLIGAFNNEWAIDLNRDLLFTFTEGAILDRQTGRRYEIRTENGINVEDYGVISRLIESKTGGPALTLGGVGQYGTQAAAEMVTVPEQITRLVRSLPPGWRTHNVQIIIRTLLVQEHASPAAVVAVHMW
jgi:hypothetical protein